VTITSTEFVVDIGVRRVSLSAGAATGALLTDCFRSLLVPSTPPCLSPADIVIDDVADGRARFRFPGGQVIDPIDHDTLPRAVLNVLERMALDESIVAANLHGAALTTPGGTGVVLVGRSRSGKTSLSAELAARGHTYLTDEMVGIDLDTGTLRAFPRPLSMRAENLERITAKLVAGERTPSGSRPLVPAEALGARTARESPAGTIVFLGHGSDPPRLAGVPAAEALELLVANCMDIAGRPTPAFTALAWLAATSTSAGLTFHDPVAGADAVETFVASARPPEAPWAVFVTGDAPDAEGLRPVAGVVTAVLGDACVVYHPPSKVVVRLNEAGSALWLDLCEGEPLGADHVDFLDRLVSLGLATPAR
jgi:hypothetical protein